jgi:putative membrane protein
MWFPYGSMGWMGFWMAFWWISGIAVLLLLVWVITRTAGSGSSGRTDDTPEQILKRRYARGELDRDDYERRLSDVRK